MKSHIDIEIDKDSGFCFGVTRAINKAEEELSNNVGNYCKNEKVCNQI